MGISSCIQHLLLGQITFTVVTQFIEKQSKVAVVQGSSLLSHPLQFRAAEMFICQRNLIWHWDVSIFSTIPH